MHIAEPPRSGGGSHYTTYRNPVSGLKFRTFCRRRPTPRYDLKAPYFSNRQHLPPTCEPPRSGGGSNYTPSSTPACALKFEFLPPEANTPLRLQGNKYPQPHSGGGTNYTTYRIPASALKFEFFAAGGQLPTTTSKQHMSLNDWISCAPASRRVAAAVAIYIPRAGSNSIFYRRRQIHRSDLNTVFPCKPWRIPCIREPPWSGGGNDYTMYRNPASGLKFGIFCRRRPTRRYGFKAVYFPKRQHLPRTREPPRSGGGSNYTPSSTPECALKFEFLPPEANTPLRLQSTRRRKQLHPASGLKFEFLPPEANTPLQLQSTIFPQTPESPTYLRAAAKRQRRTEPITITRHIEIPRTSGLEGFFANLFAAGGQHGVDFQMPDPHALRFPAPSARVYTDLLHNTTFPKIDFRRPPERGYKTSE
ncbi:hypothetical protein C8R43DRAFT_1230953 [Mycena crocata]|nr:hypothetical protein C8R43DRAFT_1230953 [Mycena crocata]